MTTFPHQNTAGAPSAPQPFKISKTALALTLSALILVILLVAATVNNIQRAQSLMENFLIQKGETVIRSVEAGSRTSMRHYMMKGGDLLETLLAENIHDEDILYIRILNENGEVVVNAGDTSGSEPAAVVQQVLAREGRVTWLDKESRLFELSDLFEPLPGPARRMHGMHRHLDGRSRENRGTDGDDGKRIISVGLLTTTFDAARVQEVHHALLMAAVLLLVGSAGLYFMFLYHSIRTAKAKLTQMQLYTDSVIESIPAALVTLDADDRVVSFNGKAEELFSLPAKQVQGLPVNQAISGWSGDILKRPDVQHEVSIQCSARQGAPIPVTISGSQLCNQEGHRIGTVLIIRDMSLIRDMELQLERSRRMAALGKMAAGIAHEIRNPLGTLRGFAQFFGAQAEEGTENRQYAEVMVSEVDRLNQNISGLLQFARPREPHFTGIDVDELLSKIKTLMQADFTGRRLTFHCPSATGIHLSCDPDLILQVVMNLLKNSISATPEGGDIRLEVRQEEGTVRLSVRDTGKGMTAEEQEKMFDPFFTTRRTGTGLGLAVSHQIIEQHSGTFEVESAPGEGTVIHVLLPQKGKEKTHG